jgi:hypothetical protein
MKHITQLLRLACIGGLLSAASFSCKKNGINGNLPTSTSLIADSLADRLQFANAKRKTGTAPKGASGASLKISFKDTLYLADHVQLPIKFLHMDTTQNVSGVFIQVQAAVIGGPVNATYYYDVPEVPILDSSDTVSVIMIGFNPASLKVPVSFNITITPHNSSGTPLAQSVKTIKVVEHTTDPKGNTGTCGLVSKATETWEWVMSYMEKSTFTSTPQSVFGENGQIIKGSCCAGYSVYGICPGKREPNAYLHFNTFYQIAREELSFYSNGRYDRRTVERGANPLPDSSNFCLPFEGRVKTFLTETNYTGIYTTSPGGIMPDIQQLGDSQRLSMLPEFSSGGGFGNPGGVIHYLDCRSLVLIQQDLEGFGQHLYKIYQRSAVEKWFEF